jgi:isocitrate/isopropylmalate dehydrogenase
MMNQTEGKAIQTIDPAHPTPSNLEFPNFAIDTTNPLAWILAITMLLKHTAQTIDAATKLIQAIAPRKNSNEKRGDRKED